MGKFEHWLLGITYYILFGEAVAELN
uniref:Uncharacterized protein n=1 Tax=Tetranychus urticae TaxID=32264 RepID=T1KMA4_TETUR